MKIFIIIFLPLVLTLPAFCQNDDSKRDHVWLFGYPGGLSNPEPPFGNAVVDFNFNPPDVFSNNGIMPFSETNSSICDKNGNLLFFTNGIYIGKGAGQPMINGTGLSPGPITNEYAEFGMIVPGGALILPIPQQDSMFMVFHGLMEWPNGDPSTIYSKWYYSVVDFTKLSGQGAVIEKNVEILSDTFAVGNLSAVRHGNGRDWWLIIQKSGSGGSNSYYSFLLAPEGLQGPFFQTIGPIIRDGIGQSLFSPDGTKYARNEMVDIYPGDTLFLYDFDRCTGLLSNPEFVILTDTVFSSGVAFSPNSRFLYLSHYKYIFQFDMEASDWTNSLDTVGIWQEDTIIFSTKFFMAQLAPDEKIYINSPGGTQTLHVINHPDLKGDSCGFVQNGFELPVYNSFSLPTFPNFRLGKWEGSPCDTIVMTSIKPAFPFPEVVVYPNPANDFLMVEHHGAIGKDLHFSLFDATGRPVVREELSAQLASLRIDLAGLAPGLYFYRVEKEGRAVKAGKVVVVRGID